MGDELLTGGLLFIVCRAEEHWGPLARCCQPQLRSWTVRLLGLSEVHAQGIHFYVAPERSSLPAALGSAASKVAGHRLPVL